MIFFRLYLLRLPTKLEKMNCLEEPGCPCVICDRKEVKHRLQHTKRKQKKEEDSFINACIQENTNISIPKEKIINTLYISKYKNVLFPIKLEYLQGMSSYSVKEHLLSLSKNINYYSGIFNRLDYLSSQFSNKRVKKDSHNIIQPSSLSFYLKDKAETHIEEWCNTITYLHTYDVLSQSDGVFKVDIYNTNKHMMTRI